MLCWCSPLLFGLLACNEAGPVIPAATTKHVMLTLTEPSAKRIFGAAAAPPKDAAGWQDVRANAEATADSARRLIRAVRGGNKTAWVEQSSAMIVAADKAAAAATARSADALAAAGDELFGTCENCHKVFQPVNTVHAEARPRG